MNGSGFAVTTALLRRLGGWHTVTMTEDYEFSAQCAMLGERVRFVPEALIYDEQPLHSARAGSSAAAGRPAACRAAELRPRPVQQLCTAAT
ncbi:MAG: glycosyltransferase [Ruthenibacterium lactatiformans]